MLPLGVSLARGIASWTARVGASSSALSFMAVMQASGDELGVASLSAGARRAQGWREDSWTPKDRLVGQGGEGEAGGKPPPRGEQAGGGASGIRRVASWGGGTLRARPVLSSERNRCTCAGLRTFKCLSGGNSVTHWFRPVHLFSL